MPGNQPGMTYMDVQWEIGEQRKLMTSESQEKATLLQRGEMVVICRIDFLNEACLI